MYLIIRFTRQFHFLACFALLCASPLSGRRTGEKIPRFNCALDGVTKCFVFLYKP